jgi:hypothetical protein
MTTKAKATTTVKVKVEVEIEIDGPFTRYALSTAFEGGVGYWCRIEGYTYPKGTKAAHFSEKGKLQPEDYVPRYALVPTFEGGSTEISTVDDESEDEPKKYSINIESLKKGWQLLAEKYPHIFARFQDEQYDAGDADVFVQLCVFGEVVYG